MVTGAGWTRDRMPVQPSKPTIGSALTQPAEYEIPCGRVHDLLLLRTVKAVALVQLEAQPGTQGQGEAFRA